jgi:8-oxo-dGTP pyrophosphatase MutT (NUDIX family)
MVPIAKIRFNRTNMSPSKKHHKSTVLQAAGGLLWREEKGKRQIALIHRSRYDDWSFPKGMVEKGETWEQAALREVGEETGCQARLGDFVGCNCYQVNEQPKVVLFWQMSLINEHVYPMHKEVDQLIWVSPEKALERLSYDNEKALLVAVIKKANSDLRGGT